MNTVNTEIFQWTPPHMSAPVDVTIAFDYVWKYANGQDYEEPYPYVEAIYLGSVDIMPIVDDVYVQMALEAYSEDKNDMENFCEPY